jgi:hypothetical protein
VAVIAFAGADPAAAELRQLPTAVTREHERDMFVMRDGSVTLGKLYHIAADGSTIAFDPLGGTSAADRRTVPASQIARVYINAPKARTVYASVLNAEPPKAAAAAAPPPAQGQAVVVQANQEWTDTGIDVRRGQAITFKTTGEIQLSAGRTSSAEGVDRAGLDPSRMPVRGMRRGLLIGRVGNSAPFIVGLAQDPVRMPATGRLFLGANDANYADNSGSFRVVIEP